MSGRRETDISAILRRVITIRPDDPGNVDFNLLDGKPVDRKLVARALANILRSLGANFLVGFEGHMSQVVSAADQLGVGFDTAYREWGPGNNENAELIRVNLIEMRIKKALEDIKGPRRIVFISDLIETGIAAGLAVDAIRTIVSHDSIEHCVFLAGVPDGKGQNWLHAKQISVHALSTYSPSTGLFGPNRAQDGSPIIGSQNNDTSPRSGLMGMLRIGGQRIGSFRGHKHHEDFLPQTPGRYTLHARQVHNYRPGGNAGC